MNKNWKEDITTLTKEIIEKNNGQVFFTFKKASVVLGCRPNMVSHILHTRGILVQRQGHFKRVTALELAKVMYPDTVPMGMRESEKLLAQLIVEYNDRFVFYHISMAAKILGLHKNTVCRYLADNGVSMRFHGQYKRVSALDMAKAMYAHNISPIDNAFWASNHEWLKNRI